MDKALRTHILETLEKGMRLDGRKATELRKVKVETGISKNAEGSAKVMIGETEIIVGVKTGIETPYDDTPESGNLMVNAELLPLSNPEFESGPPSVDSIEIARVIDRGIREGNAIDVKKLCIKKGEKVWSVMIDIIPINDAGNIMDAASLGALAALKDAKFPEVNKDLEIDYKKRSKNKIPLKQEPLAVTVYKIGDHLIVDPTIQEQNSYDARLTTAFLPNGELVAMQKGGDAALTSEEIGKMIDVAQKAEKEMRATLG